MLAYRERSPFRTLNHAEIPMRTFLWLFLLGSALPLAPAATADQANPMGVQVHVLDNGLTVYLSENHQEPRISAWVVPPFRAIEGLLGSAQE